LFRSDFEEEEESLRDKGSGVVIAHLSMIFGRGGESGSVDAWRATEQSGVATGTALTKGTVEEFGLEIGPVNVEWDRWNEIWEIDNLALEVTTNIFVNVESDEGEGGSGDGGGQEVGEHLSYKRWRGHVVRIIYRIIHRILEQLCITNLTPPPPSPPNPSHLRHSHQRTSSVIDKSSKKIALALALPSKGDEHGIHSDTGSGGGTRVYPVNAGDHHPDKLRATFQTSLDKLGPNIKPRVFYLHAPDRSVPFKDTLEAVEIFGLSNYAAWEVAEIIGLCNLHNYVKPKIYQAMYNPITRAIEDELVPCLRKNEIRLVVYNPLAGGYLAGKVKDGSIPEGRFSGESGMAKMYRARYLQGAYAEALETIRAAAEKHQFTMTEVALRWMQHHSALLPTDGVILGASNPQQLDQTGRELSQVLEVRGRTMWYQMTVQVSNNVSIKSIVSNVHNELWVTILLQSTIPPKPTPHLDSAVKKSKTSLTSYIPNAYYMLATPSGLFAKSSKHMGRASDGRVRRWWVDWIDTETVPVPLVRSLRLRLVGAKEDGFFVQMKDW
ncbi:4426_t:CDS:10, partial [Acaulospora colombiana]